MVLHRIAFEGIQKKKKNNKTQKEKYLFLYINKNVKSHQYPLCNKTKQNEKFILNMSKVLRLWMTEKN